MQKTVLFIDRFHDLSREAEREASRNNSQSFRMRSAGIEPASHSSMPDATYGCVSLDSLASETVDCVVTIGSMASERVAMAPGLPPVIRWADIDADVPGGFSLQREEVLRRVNEVVSHGFLEALITNRLQFSNVVDSMQIGVIAHDLQRKVFYFSKGAEKIAGVDSGQVLGRDCHDLFTPRLCGASCAFCDGEEVACDAVSASYTARFLSGAGMKKTVQVTRQPLRNEHGTIVGALAMFTDATRLEALERRLNETESFAGIIGADHQMQEIYELIRDLSDNDFPVVVSGESGTGKELVAAAIHNESPRRDNLFVPVNCGALPDGMIESELFGHCKGAFTGAVRDKKGRFELADNGTLFLDEIGDLPVAMQVKLLRVLQEGVFEPVGSEVSRKVNVRLICATNRDLRDMVAKGTFREDLYYRIAVVPIDMPPLRERRTDIPILIRYFLDRITERLSRDITAFSDDALSVCMNYSWPGNVRQLQNAIQFALIKCRNGIVTPSHLPPELLAENYVPIGVKNTPGKAGRRPKLTGDVVERALEKTGGNKAKAARLLGVGRATLYNFINGVVRETELV